MKITKHLKISLIVNGSLFGALALFIVIHNLIALFTGKEEKLFFFLFIVVFFLLPASVIYTTIAFLVSVTVRAHKKRKRLEEERENEEIYGSGSKPAQRQKHQE